MSDFHDKLAALCCAEVAAARRDETGDQFAAMISALAVLLGRTIGMAAHGKSGMGLLLVASNRLVADEAAGMSGLMALAAVQARAGSKAVPT